MGPKEVSETILQRRVAVGGMSISLALTIWAVVYTILMWLFAFSPVGEDLQPASGVRVLYTLGAFVFISYGFLAVQVYFGLKISEAQNATKDGLGLADMITTIAPLTFHIVVVVLWVLGLTERIDFSLNAYQIIVLLIALMTVLLDLGVSIISDRARRRVSEIAHDQ